MSDWPEVPKDITVMSNADLETLMYSCEGVMAELSYYIDNEAKDAQDKREAEQQYAVVRNKRYRIWCELNRGAFE